MSDGQPDEEGGDVDEAAEDESDSEEEDDREAECHGAELVGDAAARVLVTRPPDRQGAGGGGCDVGQQGQNHGREADVTCQVSCRQEAYDREAGGDQHRVAGKATIGVARVGLG